MVHKISCECSPIALEFDCSKGYWVHGSAGGISKTHGFPRNIIYKWWVLQIYVSLKEGNYRCWKVIFGQTHMKLPVCLVNRRFEKIQEQVQGYESDV